MKPVIPAAVLTAVTILAGCATSPLDPSPAPSVPPVPEVIQSPAPTTADQPPPPPSPVSPPVQPAPSPPVQPEPPKAAAPAEVEVFPGVWLNASEQSVRFDAIVCINAHDEQKPTVYLEQIACVPDSVEHESLVMTQARPSHIHAALLMTGLEPGKPGEFDWTGEQVKPVPPQGAPVDVVFIVNGREQDPTEWVVSRKRQKSLRALSPDAEFRFAGSTLVKRTQGETYHADRSGTLIGLTTFGTETIAWSDLYNPDAGVEDPDWIANAATVPAYATPVQVRIKPARKP